MNRCLGTALLIVSLTWLWWCYRVATRHDWDDPAEDQEDWGQR